MRRSLQRLALPLGAYLLIAVVLPMLNGALSRPGFGEHALAIASVCGALTLAITALQMLVAHIQRRRTT